LETAERLPADFFQTLEETVPMSGKVAFAGRVRMMRPIHEAVFFIISGV
jgi:hypothetical protein